MATEQKVRLMVSRSLRVPMLWGVVVGAIVSGYCSIVRFLARDRIAGRRAVEASPLVVLVHEYLGSAC